MSDNPFRDLFRLTPQGAAIDRYREGWDRIFGASKETVEAMSQSTNALEKQWSDAFNDAMNRTVELEADIRKLRELENLASQLAHAVINRQPMTARELAERVLERTDS